MSWILIALSGHFLNAFAFLMDKFLLSSKKIPSPFVYAFFIGVLGILALVLIPFGVTIPPTTELVRALVAGATYVIALVFFFSALKENEASRVVPLTGGFVPLFTLFLAFFLLDERLLANQLFAFIFLIAGGVLITIERGKRATSKNTIGYIYAIIAAFVFALSYVITKQVFIEQEFISGFMWSRIGGVLLALTFLLIPQARYGILHPSSTDTVSKGTASKQSKEKTGGKTALLFVGGQVAGGLGFVLVNYAIALGSVSLVNALQGSQYVFLLFMAILIAYKYPKILQETIARNVLWQKIIAIVMISAGVGLLAF